MQPRPPGKFLWRYHRKFVALYGHPDCLLPEFLRRINRRKEIA